MTYVCDNRHWQQNCGISHDPPLIDDEDQSWYDGASDYQLSWQDWSRSLFLKYHFGNSFGHSASYQARWYRPLSGDMTWSCDDLCIFFCKNTKLLLHVLVDLESLFIFLFRTEVSVPQIGNPFSQFFTKSRINVCQTNTQLTRGWKCGKGENLYLKLYSPNI